MLQSERKLPLADLENKITLALLNAGINPTPGGMVCDLLKIGRRWSRRKQQADSGELNKARQLENLRHTYAAIQSGERSSDTLQIARLALHGLKKGQRSIMTQRAYKRAQKSILSLKAGRHHDHATQYLIHSLCMAHLEHLGKLPPCGWDDVSGVYVGNGVQYVNKMLDAITGDSLAISTIGRYLVDENSRIRMILSEE